jgi:CRISPR/Cas system CSM-associated protein Csm3 (group 7 of RAMP superfamily)
MSQFISHYTALLTLCVTEPLHIGSGEKLNVISSFLLKQDQGDNAEVQSQDNSQEKAPEGISTDTDNNPIIPASSIKGALRRLLTLEDAKRLFGYEDGSDGTKALVTLHTAKMENCSSWHNERTRVRINRKTGVAEDKKLFSKTYIVPGVEFALELNLAFTEEKQVEKDLQLLLSLFDKGINLGAGQKSQESNLKLTNFTLSKHGFSLDENATISSFSDKITNFTFDKCATSDPAFTLTLSCNGPFLISKKPSSNDGDIDYQAETIHGKNDHPLLTASSFCGSMRAALAHYGALSGIKDFKDDPDATFSPNTTLTYLQKIFGITGYRGLLQVLSISSEETQKKNFSSIGIDRFSGGVLDEGVRTTEAFVAPAFTIHLGWRSLPDDDTNKYFEKALNILCIEGLFLGKGAGVGFGWFNVDLKKGEDDNEQ